MLRRLMATADDYTLTLLRLVLGFVMFAHGAQKLLGWFGGNGFSGTMGFFTQSLGIPAFFAFLAIMAESVGAVALIIGLLGRVAAFGIAANMAVAVLLVHAPNGLFMNWTGAQKGEGFEYHLLALAAAAVLIIRGAGAWSVDHVLSSRPARHGTFEPAPSRG